MSQQVMARGAAPKRGDISIGIRKETFDDLEHKKGPGKTWDRYLRELAGLPLINGDSS